MSRKSSIRKANKSFKIIIILLTFTLLGSFFYIYKLSDRTKEVVITLRKEKQDLLADLEKNKMFLNQLMTSNNSLVSKLKAEKDSITELIKQLKSKPLSEKTIVVYKESVNNSEERIKALMNEIESYKKQVEETKGELNVERKRNDTLIQSNKRLAKKVNDAGKLYYHNLEILSYKQRGSGKIIETNKASKIDLFKVSFYIAENEFIKPETKNFYVQILDSKTNIIGNKQTIEFGKDELVYSATTPVKYQNQTLKVNLDIPVSKLESGSYFVNVFEKSKLVLKTTITLE